MGQPRYQEVLSDSIPVVEGDGRKVRLVAGECEGLRGPVTEIAAQPLYMDVTLEPGADFSLAVPTGHTLVAYVFEGEGVFGVDEDGGGEFVQALQMLVFDDGDQVGVFAGHDSVVRFMLMAGAPFGEPIVPYGPFVMNTQEEIRQAFIELRNGTFVQT
jgi:redox-sensitive bicupin YhaK (pirin superfamily)